MGVTPATIVHGAEHALREQYGVVRTFGMIGEGFNGMSNNQTQSLPVESASNSKQSLRA